MAALTIRTVSSIHLLRSLTGERIKLFQSTKNQDSAVQKNYFKRLIEVMNAIEQKEKQKSEVKSQTTTDEIKTALLNVDLSGIKLTSAKIHLEWGSLLRLTQLRVTEELGPEFKLSEDLSLFTFYMFPSLSFDFVSSILIFNMGAFVVDDQLDQCSTENEKIIQKFRDKSFPENGIVYKWWGLAMNVCKETMGETALHQLLDVYFLSLSTTDERNKVFTGATPLTDREFLEWRCGESGYLFQFFLLLVGTRNQISDKLIQDPNYLGLNKQAAIQACIVNDLYSLRKESRDDLYEYNYVHVKMTNNQISAEAAVDDLIQEMRDAEKMAQVCGDRVKGINDPQLSQYVDGMYEMIAGNHYWSTICTRNNDL